MDTPCRQKQPAAAAGRRRGWRCAGTAAGLLALAFGAIAQPLWLLTEEEVAREAALAPGAITPRALPSPDAPTIEVRSPVIGSQPLRNPIRIELGFTPAADAEIAPATFRVHYGALRLDLTERIVARVAVGKTGLQVDNVVVPPGTHRLLLRIADTKARVGETELRFTVQ